MTTPTREQVMPEPFGYVSDWFGGPGMRFQHKPWPELHCLTHSVGAVYSASQLLQAIEDAKAAGRDQGLREAKEVCEAERRLGLDDERAYCGELMAAAIEQLRGE